MTASEIRIPTLDECRFEPIEVATPKDRLDASAELEARILSQIRQLLAEAIQEIGLRRNLHDPEHAAYREMALMDLQEAHRRVIAAAACLEKVPPAGSERGGRGVGRGFVGRLAI